MGKIWQPQPIEVYKGWLDSILSEAESKLNDWERNFIDSIEGQLNRKKVLTEKQAEILERIYTEKTS